MYAAINLAMRLFLINVCKLILRPCYNSALPFKKTPLFFSPLFFNDHLQVFAMVTVEHTELVNHVNCPACGYNNITGKETCEGVKEDGSICGTPLPKIVAA